jgi:2'-5' RNA ligase/GNAT superfamily N-acetyltransferase
VPRRRVAVVLLPPEGLTARVEGLRAAVEEPRPERLPPHVTLVPPVNVAQRDEERLAALLRSAAAAARPFDLFLGPAASFAPATPTVHLSVRGRPDDLDALGRLRSALSGAPLDRPDDRPFVPHVTLRPSFPRGRIDGALGALSGTVGGWHVDRLHLLEHHPDPGATWWEPIREEPFGGPAVVGRGGLELALRTTHLVEPAVRHLLGAVDVAPGAVRSASLVVVAERPERPGHPVGAAVGEVAAAPPAAVAELRALAVPAAERGAGVGAHLLAAWSSAAAGRGAEVLVVRRRAAAALRAALSIAGDVPVDLPDGAGGTDDDGFLRRHGFVDAGVALVRGL